MTGTTDMTAEARVHAGVAGPGRWCVAAGLVGVAQGVVVLAWPHQVDSGRYSYPFTATWYVLAQATFFLQHVPLALAVGALASLGAVRGHRTMRRSLLVAAVGLGLLALMELVAMTAATSGSDSTLGTVVNSLYAVPVVLAGGGLLVAGVASLRRAVLARPVSWTLSALGAFVVVGVTPALSTDSFVAGRLAIMAWMALFAVLGWTLQRLER